MIDSLPLAVSSSGLSNVQLGGLAAVALCIGFVGGIVGITLGVVQLPAMVGFGVSPLLAAGTNLLVTILGSIAGSWPAILQGRVVMRVVVVIGAPAIGGSFIGGRYANIVPGWVLLVIVALLMLWSGAAMILRSLARRRARANPEAASDGRGSLTRRNIVREGAVGVFIGVVGGAVGLALGVIRMPALIHVLKMEPKLATGTNLVITVFVGLSGFIGHALAGRVDWQLAMVMGACSMTGMFVGSRVSGRLDPARLRLVVGVVLVIMAPVVFIGAVARA